jgi:hypothetical protein
MSSLALYAAPFDENDNSHDNDKKRLSRNKTIKKRISSSGNIESLINKIHQNAETDTDESNTYDANNISGNNNNNLIGDDYSPPSMKLPMPVSIGAQRKTNDEIGKNTYMNNNNNNLASSKNNAKAIKRTEPLEMGMDGFNTMNDRSSPENYGSNPYFKPYFLNQSNGENRDILIEKLNYMIHLLEEQRDEKVGSITEEVILYSFLGIFIIFIVDSFARAGKYVR